MYHLQRELLRERTRCKALEEELENPMNIHRWRKLEGSDPSTYEMIQKIQTLQRRLIQKTEEVVEKELLIQVSGGSGFHRYQFSGCNLNLRVSSVFLGFLPVLDNFASNSTFFQICNQFRFYLCGCVCLFVSVMLCSIS